MGDPKYTPEGLPIICQDIIKRIQEYTDRSDLFITGRNQFIKSEREKLRDDNSELYDLMEMYAGGIGRIGSQHIKATGIDPKIPIEKAYRLGFRKCYMALRMQAEKNQKQQK